MASDLAPHDHKPLFGITVVDFGVFAGPLTARILADAGASVTHVDKPHPERAPLWVGDPAVRAHVNRGKTVVELDLKTAAGVAAAWDLVLAADVVIDNFAPGVMTRLGLGADRVLARHPTAVYVSMPGFASGDADLADLNAVAFEAAILARVGVFADMGLNRTLMGVDASYSPLPLASTYGAVFAALGTTMALYAREVTGLGDHVEVPLAAALADALVYNSMGAQLPGRYLTMREKEIERRRRDGVPCNLSYAAVQALLDPFYSNYTCADGRTVYVVAPCHLMHQRRLLQLLGIYDELVAEGLPLGDPYSDVGTWPEGVNTLLGLYPLTDPAWVVKLKTRMQAGFATRPSHIWDRLLGAAGIPGAATLTTHEWIHSSHPRAAGLITTRQWQPPAAPTPVTLHEAGPLVWHVPPKTPTSAAQRADTRRAAAAAVARRGPEPGDAALPWMAGVRVLDLCNVIAGPTIGAMLARHGADVIKVDPAVPTYDALVAVFMGLPIQRSKRSLLADLKTAAGVDILHRLVRWADVVTANQTPSQLHALGIDEASLHAVSPTCVVMHFDGYGGPGVGHKSDYVLYDDLTQAQCGIMARFGGGLATVEEHAHLGTVDVVSGVSGALATALALFKRARTGQCDTARTSLAANAQHIQTPFMLHYDGMPPRAEPSGPQAVGEHAVYRWYPTADAHVFVAGRPDATGAVLEAVGVAPSVASDAARRDSRVAAALAGALARLPTDVAVKALRRAGVAAVARTSLRHLREAHGSSHSRFGLAVSAASATFHFTTDADHAVGSAVTMFAPCSVLSRRVAVPVPRPAPKYGEHTREVLTRVAGYTPRQVEELKAAGVVADEWSKAFIPQGDPWERVAHEWEAYAQNVVSKL